MPPLRRIRIWRPWPSARQTEAHSLKALLSDDRMPRRYIFVKRPSTPGLLLVMKKHLGLLPLLLLAAPLLSQDAKPRPGDDKALLAGIKAPPGFSVTIFAAP